MKSHEIKMKKADENSTGTRQPPSVGHILPFHGTTSSASVAFSAQNEGTMWQACWQISAHARRLI